MNAVDLFMVRFERDVQLKEEWRQFQRIVHQAGNIFHIYLVHMFYSILLYASWSTPISVTRAKSTAVQLLNVPLGFNRQLVLMVLRHPALYPVPCGCRYGWDRAAWVG